MKPEKKDSSYVTDLINWTYDKAFTGFNKLAGAQELADYYQQYYKRKEDAIAALVRWQVTKCAASGFLLNIGGIVTLPATIPANLFSVLFIQLRMAQAIAIINGRNPACDEVKALALVCLAGNQATTILKSIGVKVGHKLGEKAIDNISIKVIREINRILAVRFITKRGTTGIINLTRFVPIIGGVISGVIDGVSTKLVANTAIWAFTYEIETESTSSPYYPQDVAMPAVVFV